ncbi:hypothetical protein HPP92_019589 [Vanilla planifolia]|uniref:Peptidase C45 hydrolase domain-containing protein n=1 Tax=Vanilla planifolia TaxID=51239 RepID=A0A835Q9W9_VANPL|nr:hypothetical protein HPP92_020016 [Vanilla planifolia]KAG0465425.1 hypothetical protein HPP92_019589 [Vanilla planifolia]
MGTPCKKLEFFEVRTCKTAFEMGFLIGKRFSGLIKCRVSADLILQEQLHPFARTSHAKTLLDELCNNNRQRFPNYWDEIVGTAEGSGVSLLDLVLLNFRKEILPFVPKVERTDLQEEASNDCSDVLLVNESLAVAAHNEDGNGALIGHGYMIRALLPNGLAFTAYTYAGEIPSCAFGFNDNGIGFTLNSVPPSADEILAGGIGRNFVSRDLLESINLEDAVNRILSANVSVGHNYNLIDVKGRRILNVETSSGNRYACREIGQTPLFHANMYIHLQVNQEHSESSLRRQRRAAQLFPVGSKSEVLKILGDSEDEEHPIYMKGPILYTLCTALFDLDDQTLCIFEGNPKREEAVCVLHIPTKGQKTSMM